MPNRLTVVIIFSWWSQLIIAQSIGDSSLDRKFANAIEVYLSGLGDQSPLYNGKEYVDYEIMSNIETHQFLDDPLPLFNAVPVFDPNKIIKYDPIKVKQIEVVKSKYFYGPLILNGIVNFITYDPDPSMLSDLNAVVVEYEGMQDQREFYSPVYENDAQVSSRMPDFRGLLYWAPFVNTDSKGKAAVDFFTSDMKGKYLMVIQGMTNDGRMGGKSLSFDVE